VTEAFFCDVLTDMVPMYLWTYNSGTMEIVNFPAQYNQIGARGSCPHCGDKSYFHPVASHIEQGSLHVIVSAAQCQGCKEFVLVTGTRDPRRGASPFGLTNVFPLGKPNDAVDPTVPEAIRNDFAEALRCEFIKSYKATVVMCARAIQGSAIALGAKKKKLTDQIDELFSQGKITEALKDFAHEIRVTRNLGAHPDKDGLEDISPQDAKDIVDFTREYLHHVYVMPAKLKARKTPAPTPPITGGT